MGETLAKVTLFMFFTSMLQRYNFENSAKHGRPDLSPGGGYTLSVNPFYARVTPREV